MSSVWTIIYMVVTIIFIGWLLYRVRFLQTHHSGRHDAAVRESLVGTEGGECHDQRREPAGTSGAVDSTAPEQVAAGVDDLTRIKGIGKVIAPKLQAMGIVSFAQVARLTPADIAHINAVLAFKGRIEREDWVGQAQRLMAAKTPKT